MQKHLPRYIANLVAACALALIANPAWSQPGPMHPDQIAAIIAAADRTPADRTNDVRRKPAQMLAFFAVRPSITAVDLSAAGGYTTELVARAVGPGGMVYGQSRPPNPNGPRPAQPEGNANPSAAPAGAAPVGATPTVAAPPAPAPVFRPSPVALADRVARMQAAGVATAPITSVVRPFEDPFPPELAAGKVDLVTLIFNYHDLGHMGVDRAAMNRAVFAALKPGGVYIIADHAGRPGTGISESGTLHRIEPAFLRHEVEAAGFRLVGETDFLSNPNDPRDKNTPDPPMPKDEFVVKFVRP